LLTLRDSPKTRLIVIGSNLLNCSDPIFEDSRTVDYESEDGSNEVDKSYRDSMSAYLPLSGQGYEPIHCIEERASVFQGHVPIENMENLQVVRYSTLRDMILNN
jgi:hypothetical protein